MTNPIKSFFLFCSGATASILKLKGCEIDHNKYIGIGATIFFTAVLASFSGGYALFTVFQDFKQSVAFGLLWGLIIFNLDRFIVSSIRKSRVAVNAPFRKRLASKAGEFLKALPRLILAIFISVVITRPIELRLFESEIQGQITKDLTLERTKIDEDIKVEYADIDTTEAETERLRRRLAELQNEWNRRVSVASSELEGWGGTGDPGEGPQYKMRQAEAKQAATELSAFQTQYAHIIKANEEEIKQRKLERQNKAAAAKAAIDKSPGMLKRLEALSTLSTQHLSALVASIVIMLLFISLETAPILVKLFSNRGPYDDYLDAIEHQVYATQQKAISDINDEVNTGVALSKQINASRMQAELKLVQDTLSSLDTLAPQEFHDAQTAIALQAIERWRTDQLKRLSYAPPPTPYSGQPAMPAGQLTTPLTAASPPNSSPPTNPSPVSTPVGAGGVPPPAAPASNTGGVTQASGGASPQTGTAQPSPLTTSQTATTGSIPPPAITPRGISSPPQQHPAGTGQQSSAGTIQSPLSHNGNPPVP